VAVLAEEKRPQERHAQKLMAGANSELATNLNDRPEG
jgi:hypothetical protein